MNGTASGTPPGTAPPGRGGERLSIPDRLQLHGGFCLVGAGEHARVVAEAAQLAGLKLLGCWAQEAGFLSPVLGDDACLEAELSRWRIMPFHLALAGKPGSPLRSQVLARYRAYQLEWLTVVHPTAWVSPSAQLGDGVFVGPRAVVHAGARLADHVVVNSAAVVEHDVNVDEGAQLAPAVVVGGGVRIGAWSFCGLGSLIRDHCTVGAGAVVGMGAVVVGDVAAGGLVYGNPARVRGA